LAPVGSDIGVQAVPFHLSANAKQKSPWMHWSSVSRRELYCPTATQFFGPVQDTE
jgi:hypothetical protein